MAEWIQFEKGIKTSGKPFVSISGGGNYLSFNSPFIRQYGLKDKKFVDILIKKTDGKVYFAIEFVDKEGDNSLKLNFSKDGEGRSASGMGLFKTAGIVASKLKINRFTAREDIINNKKMFIIEVPTN